MKNETNVQRASERELVITRSFNGPVHLIFDAWTKPELLKKWWVPQSHGLTLLSCDADVRAGGRYRFVIGHGDMKMEFVGQYLEVTPNARLVWTNEEAGGPGQLTTVTFEEKGGQTLCVMRELYPSKKALNAAGNDACEGMKVSFTQLDELLGPVAA